MYTHHLIFAHQISRVTCTHFQRKHRRQCKFVYSQVFILSAFISSQFFIATLYWWRAYQHILLTNYPPAFSIEYISNNGERKYLNNAVLFKKLANFVRHGVSLKYCWRCEEEPPGLGSDSQNQKLNSRIELYRESLMLSFLSTCCEEEIPSDKTLRSQREHLKRVRIVLNLLDSSNTTIENYFDTSLLSTFRRQGVLNDNRVRKFWNPVFSAEM